MTLAQAITRLNYVLRGTDDDAPTVGSDEWNYWVDTLNRKKDEVYSDVTKRWAEAFEVRSLGLITASSAPVYELPTDFVAPSNNVYVTVGDQKIYYELIHPEERRSEGHRQAFIADHSPQKLYFTDEITATEQIFGGTLYIPGYYVPADLSEDDDVLVAPDVNWLIMAAASEIAFADIVYEDKAADLNEKANDLYRKAAAKNRRGTYNNPRRTPYNNYRIRSPERYR